MSEKDTEPYSASKGGLIARACLFLADEGAEFITGANFVVDGGMTVKMIYD